MRVCLLHKEGTSSEVVTAGTPEFLELAPLPRPFNPAVPVGETLLPGFGLEPQRLRVFRKAQGQFLGTQQIYVEE